MTHLTLFNPSFRRLFADPFVGFPARFAETPGGRTNGASIWTPPVDVRESDTEVVVEAELPGISRDDISVRYHDGRLILEGKREETREARPEDCETACASGSWVRRERVLGRFHRSFDLPDSVDTSAIRAESRDGVLKVVLPKLEKAQPRQIDVSVN
jgi:HSP20 family protein